MSTRNNPSACNKLDRFLTSMIILHEVARSDEMNHDLPKYLAEAFDASAVSVALVDLDQDGAIARRDIYSTEQSADTSGDNWIADVVREAFENGTLTEVVRFVPGTAVSAILPIDTQSAIAVDIQSPSPTYIITDEGRLQVTRMLQNLATVLKNQSHRTTSKVRSKPLLITLTRAEWRVLMALDSEMPEKQIATELGTTANTLHSHIKSIYRRLGVQSRLSAIALLRRAERETLIEELQAPRGVESAKPGAEPSSGSTIGVSAHTSISGIPSSEPLKRSPAYISFAPADLCVG